MKGILVSLFALLLSATALAKPSIVWFTNLPEDVKKEQGFWLYAYYFVVATAEDLDLDLKIYFSDINHIKMRNQAMEVISSDKSRPDGIIMHNYKNVAEYVIKNAEAKGIKTLLFNAGFRKNSRMNRPREKYKHWIGQLLPDDRYAGSLLARKLIKSALRLKRNKGQTITVAGLQGNHSSEASNLRMEGFSEVLAAYPEVKFTQYFPLDWKREKAANAFPRIPVRYPELSMLWCANDSMALGVLDAIKATGGPIPGKDIVLGGIDWLPEAIDRVADGSLTTTIGGHFFEGALAVLLMYDYLKGYDFAGSMGTTIKTKMVSLTSENIEEYGNIGKKLTLKNVSEIDFRKLSKTHNPSLQSYPLSIEQVLKDL